MHLTHEDFRPFGRDAPAVETNRGPRQVPVAARSRGKAASDLQFVMVYTYTRILPNRVSMPKTPNKKVACFDQSKGYPGERWQQRWKMQLETYNVTTYSRLEEYLPLANAYILFIQETHLPPKERPKCERFIRNQGWIPVCADPLEGKGLGTKGGTAILVRARTSNGGYTQLGNRPIRRGPRCVVAILEAPGLPTIT